MARPGRNGARWRRASFALAISVALVASACAAHRFVRPTGPGAVLPADQADAIWRDATASCREVRAINATIKPSGTIDGGGVRGVELNLALTGAGDIGLEAIGGGQTVFVLKGRTDRAQLWLPHDRRIVTAPASRILDALVGLNLDPSDLLAILSGCVSVAGRSTAAEQVGGIVRLTTDGAGVFVERRDGTWRVVAGELGGLLVDYRAFGPRVPRQVGLRSEAGSAIAVDLTLRLNDVLINPDLAPQVFLLSVPSDALDTPVADLRPLGSSADD